MPRARTAKSNKPRGRTSAYAYFVQSYREKMKGSEQKVDFAELSRACSEKWKVISAAEKQPFQHLSSQDKIRYDREMLLYVPPKGTDVRGKKRRGVKDPNAPKRSLSAFFWFCNDERSNVKGRNPEYSVGETAKELGRMWGVIDPVVKGKYQAMADRDKERYGREMEQYKQDLLNPTVEENDDDEEEYEEEEEDE